MRYFKARYFAARFFEANFFVVTAAAVVVPGGGYGGTQGSEDKRRRRLPDGRKYVPPKPFVDERRRKVAAKHDKQRRRELGIPEPLPLVAEAPALVPEPVDPLVLRILLENVAGQIQAEGDALIAMEAAQRAAWLAELAEEDDIEAILLAA